MNDKNDMNRDSELDPVARLRGADPAQNVEPREGFAADVVARTLATANESADVTAPPAPSAPVADLSTERARRRPRWLAYAAVAASVAIVGGAGFGLGSTLNSPVNMASGAAPAISLQSGAGAPMQEGGPAQAAAGGGLAAQGKMAAPGTADSIYPYGFGRNTFTSSGLSTSAGTAKGYGFDARGAANAESITALAAALGVQGEAVLKDGSWSVGPNDGTAPSVTVSLDGTLSFSYVDPQINPWDCGMSIMPVEPDAAASSGAVAPDVIEPCVPPASLPSEQAATDALKSLIAATGRDANDFEFASETWEGSFTRNAQAWLVVDGQRINQFWSIELTDAGVYSAYGSLAALVSLGDYPIVSEQQAFERLSDSRFGAQMMAMPFAQREQPIAASTEWVPPTEPPATPSAGTSLSWPVNNVNIVSARLGLTSQWQPDGSVLVVPAYEFTDADGGTWSVIAVADSKLNFATN